MKLRKVLIALLLALFTISIITACKVEEDDPIIPEGPETGTYCCYTDAGDYSIKLHSGNKFALTVDGEKTGVYTVEGETLTLDFDEDADGVITGTIANNTVAISYNATEMTFYNNSVVYTVTFDTVGGSAVASQSVVYGKKASEPTATPTKVDSAFIGWYADSAYTTKFDFSAIVAGDVTVYARWAEDKATVTEFNVTFDYNYAGAPAAVTVETIGGKLYNLEAPVREGYNFKGWWVSYYGSADKLSYEYKEGAEITAHTTLYALWVKVEAGNKLEAPVVNVNENGASWAVVTGARGYAVVITTAAGEEVYNQEVATANVSYAFEPAVDYIVYVTAVANNAANNSEAAVRYYKSNALAKVSIFTVEGTVLQFNAVENAEEYFVTVVCGNASHKHNRLSVGDNTYYDFGNCTMTEQGITFVVTATAAGYAESVSDEFNFVQSLEAVTGIAVSAEQVVTWNKVDNADSYTVVVAYGEEEDVYNVGTATTFDFKGYAAGEYVITVIANATSYNASSASYTYNKEATATPANVSVNGTTVTWGEVAEAAYIVEINGTYYNVEGTSYDLTTVEAANSYVVKVAAVVNGVQSAWSDAVTAYGTMQDSLTYTANTVYWSPVVGATGYEVMVNDGEVEAVAAGANSAAVVLTKMGANTVSVRSVKDAAKSDWVSIEVTAYTVVFETLGGTPISNQYVAQGDKIALPVASKGGYDFVGWFNESKNGSEYTEEYFTGNTLTILYAYYTPASFTITYVASNVEGSETVTYGEAYTLKVPEVGANYIFNGWFSLPGGNGTRLTDKNGNSLDVYNFTTDIAAYANIASAVLDYQLLADGTYAVKAGVGFDGVTEVTIPAYYFDGAKTVPVTRIPSQAFAYRSKLTQISIPDTIKEIDYTAFTESKHITYFDIYAVDETANYERLYWSHDGAIMFENKVAGVTQVRFFPLAFSGSYTVPEGVHNIPQGVFTKARDLLELTLPTTLQSIDNQAFYYCSGLTKVSFTYGAKEDASLYINSTAFQGCSDLAEINLPKHAEFEIALFENCKDLKTITIEEGGVKYATIDGMVVSADKTAIIYCPKAYVFEDGSYTIPSNVYTIGDNAFKNRLGLYNLVVPYTVSTIGEGAFAECYEIDSLTNLPVGLTNVTFKGGRYEDLTIGESAFANNAALKSVVFEGKENGVNDGAITIGTEAFAGNVSVTEVIFKAGVNVKEIGKGAFSNLYALNTLTFADGAVIRKIGESAFENCHVLKTITIPADTTSVGNNAFKGCSQVETINIAVSGNVTLGTGVFADCERITHVYIPAQVTTFDGSILAGCDAINDIVVDPANTSLKVKDGILYDYNFTEIMYYPKALGGDLSALPATLTKIGAGVFQNNQKITSVVIPANIKEIGDQAFNNCGELASVTFEASDVALTIGANAFSNCYKLTVLDIPARTVAIGAGVLANTPVTAVELPEGITAIGDSAFENTKITTFNVPGSVVFIGAKAFANNSAFASITFAEGTNALSIGDQAFVGTSVVEVAFPARTVSLGKAVFSGVKTLTKVEFVGDSQLTSIGDDAFNGASALESINIPHGVIAINKNAFMSTTALTTVTIPNTVTAIYASAFKSSGITSIVFEKGGEADLDIYDYAFAAANLESITIPARTFMLGSKYVTYVFSESTMKGIAATSLKEIKVEADHPKYMSTQGIIYTKDEYGNAVTLEYCPIGNNGDIVIPKTVTLLRDYSFFRTTVHSVVFEEFAKDDSNYGEQLLTIGEGKSTVFNYAKNIVSISLPSHLAYISKSAFNNSSMVDVIFNQDSTVTFGSYAFQSCSALEELNLPAIPDGGLDAGSVFTGISGLKTVTFNERSKVTELGMYTFSSCSSLVSIEIPASVKIIGDSCFDSCESLSDVTFAENSQLYMIDMYAFGNCSSLETLIIPDGTEILSMYMLYYSGIVTIEIPDTVSSLDASVFERASSLENIVINKTNPYYASHEGIIYDKALTNLIVAPASRDLSTFTLPASSVTKVAAKAFAYYGGSKTITLPEGLVTLNKNAFTNATFVTVNLPASIKTIGERAFYNCSKMKEFNIADGTQLETIGKNAFYGTKVLTAFYMPDTVTSVGEAAFNGAKKLEDVKLSANLTELAKNMFKNAPLTNGITIPAGVTKIGDYAFQGAQFAEITIPKAVETIGTQAFVEAGVQKVTIEEGSQLKSIANRAFYQCENLTTINLPNGLEEIGEDAFRQSALNSLNIPNTVKEIDVKAFAQTNITTVELVAGMTSIVKGLFQNCKELTSVVIPASVTVIEDLVFDGCVKLKTVTFAEGSQLTTVGEQAFMECLALTALALPDTVTSIGSGAFDSCGFKEFTLPAGVTVIEDVTFARCTFETVTIPETVTTIGANAFYKCPNLTTVNMASSVTFIGDEAFAYCPELTTVNVADSVSIIGNYAFSNNPKLTTINLPTALANIGVNPFANCPSLTDLTVTETEGGFVWENGALYDSDMYTLIYYSAGAPAVAEIAGSVFVYGESAFAGSNVTSIVIAVTVKAIPESAFEGCVNLTSVTIPMSVTSIGKNAFADCTGLTQIVIPKSVTDIDSSAFDGCTAEIIYA